MLELRGITKDYVVGGEAVHALRGIDLTLRKNEFVSILGQSGCGKTTLLNIIGGLDHYTSGELFIDGVSTKNYNDRDWDTYRNHRIGFVFQSYNLIPHQTVSENVELALNISGVPKAERVRRAHEALDRVGLSGMYNKKPNQMSGGQMQRVAIARALVNDPEIILADEPTGALDSSTSLIVMDILKEISKDRLVIMVTHNPELAEKYSTRIIRLLDGLVIDDTDPYMGESEEKARKEKSGIDGGEESVPTAAEADGQKQAVKSKKSKLSFWSAFNLSARNLLSKLKRTILVCFAGSIGIIGVASVLAVSAGVTDYIQVMQNEMLSGNPVTIAETAMNLSGLTAMQDRNTQEEAVKKSIEAGKINVDYMVEFLAEQSDNLSELIVENEITQEYLDYVAAMPKEYYAELGYGYGINTSYNLYTDYHFTGHDGERMSLGMAQTIFTALLGKTIFSEYASMASMVKIHYSQAPQSVDFINSQYDVISQNGKIATEANELMIVLNKDQELSDLLLAQLGYYTQDEFMNIAYRAKKDENGGPNSQYDPSLDKHRFDFSEILGKTFTWYPNDAVYYENPDPIESKLTPYLYKPTATSEFKDGFDMKITAILIPKEDTTYGSMNSGIYYTPAFTKKFIESGKNSAIVKKLGDAKRESFAYAGMQDGYGLPKYNYDFTFEGVHYEGPSLFDYVGSESIMTSAMNEMMGGMTGGSSGAGVPSYYFRTLTLRALGGEEMPNNISIYPVDFEKKDLVTAYLDKWNTDKPEGRKDIIYSDNLAIIINLINGLIDAVTAALIAFTSLSLVVSTVMIAIITYVSVIERIKEIGVIRSLGGRKRDVSMLFNAETFIIGAISGVLGIIVTFFITLIINAVVNSIVGIGTIATLTVPIALIMIGVSIALTLISGLIPASLAARKDPVEALRTE